jgi:tRNA(Ile)-lysidine synthase
MSTHPPTLLTLARRTITDTRMFSAGARVLAAVSGGPDSMALLHVLARLRAKLGFELVAHGVDHGLRAEASRELDQAAAFACTLEVPFSRTRTSVAPGGNLQARARAARLAALRGAASQVGATCLATGHHADDRAETLLLRLLRGASPAGLAVLAPRRADLVRPLIRARRRDIDTHIERHNIPFSSDPSNQDPRFLRVRVRHELVPLLESLSPGIVRHLNGLADDLRARARGDSEDVDDTYIPSLPRATRRALIGLADSRSSTVRVSLPHGLVVSFEPPRRK